MYWIRIAGDFPLDKSVVSSYWVQFFTNFTMTGKQAWISLLFLFLFESDTQLIKHDTVNSWDIEYATLSSAHKFIVQESETWGRTYLWAIEDPLN